ncbi:flagellar motor protein MotD [Herminiimonas contaminans]|uniref:Flagellar motor protein MotD n=1 Tax=Herminiimonas contaminans TaxID=1111140 RepID=A0ABS0ENU0_9BURK|nr:flagellar motor protein MotD [Herminiimonas contaminans]MBF8176530.1 flagellar motor protein MotD [Herminiimonas contaminans]
MARRRKYEEEHENHERWLVSYADFITLLFAFFVVMYAISSVNEGKYRILSSSLGIAFGGVAAKTETIKDPVNQNTPILPLPIPSPSQRANEAVVKREKARMTSIARDILKAMAPLVSQGKVRVTQTNRGVSVEINASVLFAPGEAKLNAQSEAALRAVAQVLKDVDNDIQVEGHTDNTPINNSMFPSNWELSAVRASSVVRLFLANGVAEKRLVAMGHGANLPVDSNDTTEGRLRNRRVQLMILSGMPDVVTEVPVTADD